MRPEEQLNPALTSNIALLCIIAENRDMQAAPGLRQRKRIATFQALSRAAIDLALEAGARRPDHRCHRRTRQRFPPHLLQLLPVQGGLFHLAPGLARYPLPGCHPARPEAESVWDVLQRAAEVAITDPHADLALVGASERVLSVSPSLIALLTSDARALDALHVMRERFATEITRRSRTDLTTDVYPQLMIECAGAIGTPARHAACRYAGWESDPACRGRLRTAPRGCPATTTSGESPCTR